MKQPDALGYAVSLESRGFEAEAAELRNLHDLLGKANVLCRIREARIAELRAALDDAREMVIFWGGYASEYMQKKYKLQKDIDQLTEALK